jgi:hypothetical protein
MMGASRSAREREFAGLNDDEALQIEAIYHRRFGEQ